VCSLCVIDTIDKPSHIRLFFRSNDQSFIRIASSSQLHNGIVFSGGLEINTSPQGHHLSNILTNECFLSDIHISHNVVPHALFEYILEGSNRLLFVVFVGLELSFGHMVQPEIQTLFGVVLERAIRRL